MATSLGAAEVLRSIENILTVPSPSPADLLGLRKRKRPPMLEIPVVPQDLPEVEEQEADSALVLEGSGWGVFCKRGRRKRKMEDFYSALPAKGFFGVFDGHGGKESAAYAAENLHRNITIALEKHKDLREEDAVKAAFLKTDHDFLEQGSGSGSCCVMALVRKENIVVSNLGDCRAVICRGGVAEALTTDHTAKNVEEQRRIHEKGGFIQDRHGICRVQGILAVTRTFGDRQLKEFLLAEPDTVLIPWSSDMDFLVLASDGLWDKVGNQEVVDAIMNYRSDVNKQAKAGWDLNMDGDTKTNTSGEISQEGKKLMVDDAAQKKGKVVKQMEVNKLKSGSENISPCDDKRIRGLKDNKAIKGLFSNAKFDKDYKLYFENRSPSLKLRRISMNQSRWDMTSLNFHNPFSTTETDENIKPGSGNKHFPSTTSQNQQKCVKPLSCSNLICEVIPTSRQENDLGGACERVANIALTRGSSDDITIMIVDLKQPMCN